MYKTQVLRQATRALARSGASAARKPVQSFTPIIRPFSMATTLHKDAPGEHEGKYATTDASIQHHHPEEHEMPSSKPVRGKGGEHSLPTLASFSLNERVVVVTGGARGLGLVMGQGCVISGADLAIVDLNKEEGQKQAEELIKTFKQENPEARVPKITSHYCDVSDPKSVSECFAEIVAAHGKVDNLVTSAGFCENIDAVSYPFDKFQKLMAVNISGSWLWATETARHLMGRNAPGSIVCIGSMSGSIVNVPQPQAPYNLSKAAVRHMVSSLAVEWAQKGIRVNTISPGYMATALTKAILDKNPALKNTWTSLIPTGKMGEPSSLMGAVVYLCSDASSYMTGAELTVDGGYTRT